MKRRLFTILAALSLLLFVAILTLWVKSYFSADLIYFDTVFSERFVRSNYGILRFARNDFHAGDNVVHRTIGWVSLEPDRGFCGPVVQDRSPCFVFGPFSLGGADSPMRSHSAFTLPHWSLATLTAIAPLVWFNRFNRSRRTRRRVLNRLCVRCGYDLRTTPDRCPECGEVVSAADPSFAEVRR